MKIYFLILFLAFSTLSFAQQNECARFKNGNFKIVDSEHGDSYIERKGSKQIEYGEGSKLKLAFKVKWVNTCTYTLELKKVLENSNNLTLPEDMILTVEIVKTTENSYLQKSTSNLYNLIVESEVIKLDEFSRSTNHK
jgi:hypothetical protein